MKKKIAIILSCIVLVAMAGYIVIGNPVIFINNNKLEHSIKSIDAEVIKLNEVVPFDWDVVYTLEPYASKESIEEIVGFKSADIKENNINEGMVHLLFVKDKKVVGSVLGYSENLGYNINFTSKVTFEENAQFNVTKTHDITTLTYTK